ncbi:hypothetical protein, variant [Aphanomyces invadans]|uniref:Uncharacterized protein n=1 Tax=Aphanomyces invadans TaxID=157072 RepID=A0A024TGS1_9STRA|nr:hypothetical protein, variant [Aphanomyces invadans]ETV93253.1 hypothetical protein, variant [Aphanomyces invadans]|eukprot:XP_008878087.1 hypothetical protein, variant [Aphanomyces invadans]
MRRHRLPLRLLSAAFVAVHCYKKDDAKFLLPLWSQQAAQCHSSRRVHSAKFELPPSIQALQPSSLGRLHDRVELSGMSESNACTPLHEAASLGLAEDIVKLIANGANVNASDAAGTTPLMIAASLGHRTICQCLVDANADLNAADADGSTALHVAAYHGQLDIAAMLIHAGADVSSTRPDGINVLIIAIREGHQELAMALLPFFDWTEFHVAIAAAWGHVALVDDLVALRPDLVGLSAIHAAVERGHLATVKALLHAPLKNRQDVLNSAMLHAAKTGQLAVLHLLLDEGANVAAADETGNTVIHLAARHNHVDVLMDALRHVRSRMGNLLCIWLPKAATAQCCNSFAALERRWQDALPRD